MIQNTLRFNIFSFVLNYIIPSRLLVLGLFFVLIDILSSTRFQAYETFLLAEWAY